MKRYRFSRLCLGAKSRSEANPPVVERNFSATLALPCAVKASSRFPLIERKEDDMDKDRIAGSAEQAKGKVKEVAGKVAGDAKLEAEGKSDRAAGKVQNAVGGLRDKLRGK
jgi:uncharacterized protein YjbJ (UPF0337 family)